MPSARATVARNTNAATENSGTTPSIQNTRKEVLPDIDWKDLFFVTAAELNS
jgi:hypothetical protein